MINKKIVFFFPRHQSSWNEMNSVAELLLKSEKLVPSVVITNKETLLIKDRIIKKGYEVIDLTLLLTDLEKDICKGIGNSRNKIIKLIFGSEPAVNSFLIGICYAFIFAFYYFKNTSKLINYFKFKNIHSFVVPGDRELGANPAIILTGKKLKIPIIIHGSFYSFPWNVIRVRYSSRKHMSSRSGPLLNFLVGKFFRNSVKKYKDNEYIFSPGWLTLGMWLIKYLPSNPWVMGSGLSSYSFIKDKKEYNNYIELGVPEKKLILTGKKEYDILWNKNSNLNNLKLSYCEKNNISFSEKIVIYAIPLYLEIGITDYQTHREAVKKVIDEILGQKANLIISFHPRADRSNIIDLLDHNRITIEESSLIDFISIGDLFICGSSMTLEWAILSEIPIINYDYSNHKFNISEIFNGIVETDKINLNSEIRKLLSDSKYRNLILNKQKILKNYYLDVYDNQCSHRIANFFNEF